MSGGFFRGTSADQDTRFSNKQAKLLKSQKFAPELDHAVDMKKVNLDVMKPWIATRVTELLGFEDEVLINFIYELLEKKVVDGKKVQIQLTGFMEKNTGKFMKELWSLLLTAQNNVSGVPQQFLDAKEEETRKKKAETDRITQEIQKMREREEREFDQEKQNKMGADVDNSRNSNPVRDSVSEFSLPKTAEDKKDRERRHSPRTKSRRSKSPHSNERSPVSRRSTSSSDRSSGKPFSNSRGYSQEGLRARSSSISSGSRKLSASPVGRRRSPLRRSDSPARKKMSVSRRSISPRHRRSSPNLRSPLRRSPQKRRRSTSRSRQRYSPIRKRSPHARYRSPSLPHRRSPSPPRRKSPTSSRHRSPSPSRRRSPSPLHRISPSPPRRRSPSPPLRRRSPSPPLRRRSPSPPRRRSPSPPRRRYPSPPWRRSPSPLRQRSPSPMRRRSPVRRKSPSHLRHRSPIRRRSLSPAKRRSPTPLKGRSPLKYQRSSPLPSPRSRAADSRVSLRQRNRSRSPDRSWIPSYRSRRSLSRDGDEHVNGIHSSRYRDEDVSERAHRKKSPDHHSMGRNTAEHSDLKRKVPDTVSRQRDLRVKSDTVSLDHSDFQEDMNPMKSRSPSLSGSPVKQSKKRLPRHDNPETNEGKTTRAREDVRHRTDYLYKRSKHSPVDVAKKSISDGKGLEIHSPDRSAVSFSPIGRDYPINLESRKEDRQLRSEIDAPEKNDRVLPLLEGKEYGPGRVNEHRSVGDVFEEQQIKKQSSRDAAYFRNSTRDDHSRSKDEEYKESLVEDYAKKSNHKVHKSDQLDYMDTDSEEGDTYRYHSKEKRKNKKFDNHKRDLDVVAEYDTQVDDKKEAKRRRKDEKRQHKEERRRRREERHRRRLERRAGKLELKSVDTVTPPSDLEKNLDDAHRTDDEIAMQGVSHLSDTEETASEQKKLEIDLRKKALESLRAKKAVNP